MIREKTQTVLTFFCNDKSPKIDKCLNEEFDEDSQLLSFPIEGTSGGGESRLWARSLLPKWQIVEVLRNIHSAFFIEFGFIFPKFVLVVDAGCPKLMKRKKIIVFRQMDYRTWNTESPWRNYRNKNFEMNTELPWWNFRQKTNATTLQKLRDVLELP